LPEASDLALDPTGQVLWTVSDANGTVYELGIDGSMPREPIKTQARDLEGIALDPKSGHLFAVDEATSKVTEIAPDGRAIGGFGVDVPPGGAGLEGIAYDPVTDGFVLVRERNPAELIFVDRSGKITSRARVATEDLSAVAASPNSRNLFVVARFEEAVLEVDRSGKRLNRLPVNIPGIEGLAFDSAGTLYVITDRGRRAPSTLYVFRKGAGA
jgi:uncharacterized protein YjiK